MFYSSDERKLIKMAAREARRKSINRPLAPHLIGSRYYNEVITCCETITARLANVEPQDYCQAWTNMLRFLDFMEVDYMCYWFNADRGYFEQLIDMIADNQSIESEILFGPQQNSWLVVE